MAKGVQTIDRETRDILRSCLKIDGNRVEIVQKLDRMLYEKVNNVLVALKGRWVRKEKAHIFDADVFPEDAIDAVIASGQFVDMKKMWEFFETPVAYAESLACMAGPLEGKVVLEPSAGRGALLRPILAQNPAAVIAVEANPDCSNLLGHEYLSDDRVMVLGQDFLTVAGLPPIDAVVMNPPFGGLADTVHVRKAYEHLAPGGRLVSVMGPGWTFRSDRRSTEFRNWFSEVDGEYDDNPEGLFLSSGTGVRTITARIRKI